MGSVSKLIELKAMLKAQRVFRIAVVLGQDAYTLEALQRGASEGFIHAILIGPESESRQAAELAQFPLSSFSVCAAASAASAAAIGVALVKSGKADVLMKGLISTDVFLKAVIDKQQGLMLADGVLSYVAALEIPRYPKLLLFSDPAVIPHPNVMQMEAMLRYSLQMAHKLGVTKPKVALVSASEKFSLKYESHAHYAHLKELALQGVFGPCTIDGPLDLFLSCSPNAVETKQVDTPVGGDADILIFPNLESSNPFYKGLMLFAEAELGGLIRGTTHPVVVMSRSESALSKYYCLLLACIMCDDAKE